LERHEKASARVRAANPNPTIVDDANPVRKAPAFEMRQPPVILAPPVHVSPLPTTVLEDQNQRDTDPLATQRSPSLPEQRDT
jgi:hypothetical protein